MDNSWKMIIERNMAFKYHPYRLRKWKSETLCGEKTNKKAIQNKTK